ncbi:MAG: polyprenyl synthetase family protein [Brevinematia bacterium]
MKEFFDRFKREGIDDYWFFDVLDRIYEFSLSGKMLRGGLVIFSDEMFSGRRSNDSKKCAVAIELLQSGLLIHDDIMDDDIQRRGQDTLFFQYKKVSEKKGIDKSYEIGKSLGICAGNIAFSLSFEVLSNIENKNLISKLIYKFSKEMSIVNVGQMKDVLVSGFKGTIEEEEIMSIYKYKTSRYSFSLPLSLGAIIGNASSENIRNLEELGEYFGIMFQIQDDKIGLISTSEKLGKPRGSDIKENKKTIFHALLFKHASQEESRKLLGIFGKQSIEADDIDYVIDLCKKYGIFDEVNRKVMKYVDLAKRKIILLDVDDFYKRKLEEFIDYNLVRDK